MRRESGSRRRNARPVPERAKIRGETGYTRRGLFKLNEQLRNCSSYVVKGSGDFRFPLFRLCPYCLSSSKKITPIHIDGSRKHCKWIDDCPGCGKNWCASCLQVQSDSHRADYWNKCPTGVKGRQQVRPNGDVEYLDY
eukprot:CAMPEP_0174252808 /NCGR_PEP_ID=MMETSP0439-20130205/2175_1 /TAXON_ID=0 /ORGANISM="Stereomyxa ramosa, Strain Chinc5" /LENGTH=137 /DNA_ID=CAMNT_0015333445 /DNA_START=32 /DNA_END=445 /DNA_ORIENTATION=-